MASWMSHSITARNTSVTNFLGAVSERDHWLLLMPLQSGIMPFEQLRVRASELQHRPLPTGHILVVENEQCLYQLPSLPDCIAVLGTGLNLGWVVDTSAWPSNSCTVRIS